MERMSGSDDAKPIVVIGGGLTGGNAAATLRDEGFQGRVVLIGPEPGVPFGRPPLSKTYLRSEEDLEGWYVRPAEWWEENEVERLTQPVASVDPGAHTVVMESGQELEYQKALIATGGRNRRFDIPGDRPGWQSTSSARLPSAMRSRTRSRPTGMRWSSGWGSSGARSWRP